MNDQCLNEMELTLLLELFRCDIRFRSTQSLTQMSRLLPAHSEDIAHSKVGDLDVSPRVQKQVLRLDITMSYTHRVKVCNTVEDLLEAADDFSLSHASALDGCIEVSTGAVLHDFAPVVSVILDEVDSLDDVHVVKSRRNTELGRELLDVFLFGLVLATFTEFLGERVLSGERLDRGMVVGISP